MFSYLTNPNSFINLFLLTILPSVFFYRQGNIYLQSKNRCASEKIRILSTFHAVSTITLSFLYLYNRVSSVYFIYGLRVVSYGFFLMDLSHIILYKNQYSTKLLYSYYLHHIGVLFALTYMHGNAYILARGYISEISTPFMNLSWFLNKTKYKNHLYFINGLLILYFFLYARIYNIWNLLYTYSNNISFFYNLIGVVFLFLNMSWTYGLGRIYYKDFMKYITT